MSFDEQPDQVSLLTEWLWLIAFVLLVGFGFAAGAIWIAERLA